LPLSLCAGSRDGEIGKDWMGKFGDFYFSKEVAECARKNVLFIACL